MAARCYNSLQRIDCRTPHEEARLDMLRHDLHDENSAPNQGHYPPEPAPDADLAQGVVGAEPPLEATPARRYERELSAAGLSSILETGRHGLPAMGVARTVHTLRLINQKDGFDCPSCAWPDPDAERKRRRVLRERRQGGRLRSDTHARHARVLRAAQRSRSCSAERPLARATQAASRTRWCCERGASTTSRSRGRTRSSSFAVSSTRCDRPTRRCSTRPGAPATKPRFCISFFVRQFGTNNLPDCSNMCHESSGLGLTESIGIGKGTVKLEDFEHADSHLHHRAEPGHQPPAHADRAREGRQATAARSSASTRCPRRG